MWHFCGNFCMSRRALQKLQRRGRYEQGTKLVFRNRSKKGPKIVPHVSNLRSRELLTQGAQIHPWAPRLHATGSRSNPGDLSGFSIFSKIRPEKILHHQWWFLNATESALMMQVEISMIFPPAFPASRCVFFRFNSDFIVLQLCWKLSCRWKDRKIATVCNTSLPLYPPQNRSQWQTSSWAGYSED